MRRALLAIPLALLLAAPAAAQPAPPAPGPPGGGPRPPHGAMPGGEALPLPRIVALVEERYEGRLLDARLRRERDEAFYELRWLTPAGDVLRIRMAARSGAMLEVDGPGLLDARRP